MRIGEISFQKSNVAILVLGDYPRFLYGTLGASTAPIIHVVQFQTTVSKSASIRLSLQEYKERLPSGSTKRIAPHLQMISSGETAFGFRKEIYVDIEHILISTGRGKRRNCLPAVTSEGKIVTIKAFRSTSASKSPVREVSFRRLPRSHIYGITERRKVFWLRVPSMLGNVRYLVLRNGKDSLGIWFTEKRIFLRMSIGRLVSLHQAASRS